MQHHRRAAGLSSSACTPAMPQREARWRYVLLCFDQREIDVLKEERPDVLHSCHWAVRETSARTLDLFKWRKCSNVCAACETTSSYAGITFTANPTVHFTAQLVRAALP
jgi:hypothetical protein